MANTGRYETAVLNLLPSSPKTWEAGYVDLLSAASEVDRLTDRIVADSKSMARKFESYAAEIAARNEGWDPTGYSTLRDIAMNTAKLEVERRQVHSLVRIFFGKDAAKAFAVALVDAAKDAA